MLVGHCLLGAAKVASVTVRMLNMIQGTWSSDVCTLYQVKSWKSMSEWDTLAGFISVDLDGGQTNSMVCRGTKANDVVG